MSPMVSIGLVGVSTHTSLVRPGTIAAATASTSATGAGLWSRPQTLATLSKRRKRAAVGVVGDDDVVAGPGERPDDGVLGGEAGGEGEPALAVLDRRQGTLQRRTRGVGGAAVLVAAAQAADTVLLVGAAGVDGRVDRPGHRVGLVAGVDRTRLEPGLVGAFLGHDAEGRPAAVGPAQRNGRRTPRAAAVHACRSVLSDARRLAPGGWRRPRPTTLTFGPVIGAAHRGSACAGPRGRVRRGRHACRRSAS